jgi:DNA (cytosine-5)-methyltransferase 1
MILAVPPGGNWKDIPDSVPSKRLEQIRRTGGRTTLYGRLRWDAPSFTVTTYFNRPGNGCYIHPKENRVLTSLEAARLQSFPDSYSFHGSKTSRTKQIGNAVPPLLAYAVGAQIKKMHPEIYTTADLFCGAGGLTLGLKWAGFNTVVANDFFKEAGLTYSANNPEVDYVHGDITSVSIRNKLLSSIKKNKGVDLIVGGPPCQGFSNAGLRMIDDPRNALYKNFVEIVKAANPKIFVMENVEGIVSINQGKTFAEIKETFRALGYDVSGRKLLAAAYGVPQKRKRVLIIGNRIGSSEKLFPQEKLDPESYLTVRDAIGDIPSRPTDLVDDWVSVREPLVPFQQFIQGKMTPKKFVGLL